MKFWKLKRKNKNKSKKIVYICFKTLNWYLLWKRNLVNFEGRGIYMSLTRTGPLDFPFIYSQASLYFLFCWWWLPLTLLSIRRRGSGRSKKGRPKMNSTSGVDVSTSQFRSGVLDVRDKRRYGSRCGIPLHRKNKWGQGLVLSSHDINGGSYKRIN